MKDYLFQECHPVLFNQFWRIKFRTLDKQLKVFKNHLSKDFFKA